MTVGMRIAASVLILPALLTACGGTANKVVQPTAATPSVHFVSPPPLATSTCGTDGVVAVTASSYIPLLDCLGSTLAPPPVIRLRVGGALRVAGFAWPAAGSLRSDGAVLHIDGTTVVAAAPGKATVSETGVPCSTDTATQPATCPLLTVLVS